MSTCRWCGKSTSVVAVIAEARTVTRNGVPVTLAPVLMPRCVECARRHAKHRAADAEARYIRQARADAVEQLHLHI